MRRPALLAALAIAALTLAGCGSSGPKRTVDARAEALRFFPADAPLVALLDTAPEIAPERSAMAAELAGFAPWESIRSSFLARLSAAGLPLSGLAALVRSEDPEPGDGLPLSQLAVGLEPGPDPDEPRVLVVLVTDQTEAMERLFRRSAASGPMRLVGERDEARIYDSPQTAFAVRDGVMLAADDPASLRAAIDRRDGDDDAQLDDGEVKSLIGELPRKEPLEIYADLAQLRRDDLDAAAMAQREPWMRRLGKASASLGPRLADPVLDLFSEIEPAPADDQVLPDEEGRASFAVSAATIRQALGGAEPAAGLLGRLSISAAPLAAAVIVTGDELRAKLRLSP
jgi:hypothetical protein